MTCSICRHPDRADIDAAIVAGETTRGISGRFSLSKSAVHRHLAHVGDALRAADGRDRAAVADDLLQEMAALESGLWGLLEDLDEDGSIKDRLAVFKELREALEFRSKLIGAMPAAEVAVTVETQETIPMVEAVQRYLALTDQVVEEEIARRMAHEAPAEEGPLQDQPEPVRSPDPVVIDFEAASRRTEAEKARAVREAFAM